jgi:hypothetical protein
LEKGHLTENLTSKISQMTEKNMTESSYDRKLFLKNGHLKERSFDRKFIGPKVHLTETFFLKSGHLTEKVFDKMKNNLDSS